MHSAAPAPYAHTDTVLVMSSSHSAVELAAACRATALAFVNDAPRWGKAELALWLLGPYTQLTSHASSTAVAVPERPQPMLAGSIDPRMIDRVVRAARSEVLDALARARNPEAAASWVFSSFSAGAVVRCEDRVGGAAWLPTSQPRRLADRVLSLFVVDYLVRPFDYESGPTICTRCQRVDFGAAACSAVGCGRVHRSTFVVAKRRGATLPYSPESA